MVLGLLASLALFACGSKQEAKAPDANPWADYKGTYAAGVPDVVDAAPDAKKPKSSDRTGESKSADSKSTDSATTTSAEPKPKGGAKKPATSAADSRPASAEPKPKASASKASADGDDAKSMYGIESTADASADPRAADPKPKTAPKKRPAGKKAGAKKAPPKQ